MTSQCALGDDTTTSDVPELSPIARHGTVSRGMKCNAVGCDVVHALQNVNLAFGCTDGVVGLPHGWPGGATLRHVTDVKAMHAIHEHTPGCMIIRPTRRHVCCTARCS